MTISPQPTQLVVLVLLPLLVSRGAADDGAIVVGSGERLMVVAPHPDDEALAAAGLIRRVIATGGRVSFVLVTAGDAYMEAVAQETGSLKPRPAEFLAYGARRLSEARAMVRGLRTQRVRMQFLGFPDGGLSELLHAHWQHTQPEHSQTTQAMKPPYTGVVDPAAAYDGDDLRRELTRLLRDDAPTTLVFPDPLDRHPDHHAVGVFMLLALRDWRGPAATDADLPRMLAFLVHWPDWPPGWNRVGTPAAADDEMLALPATLPARGLQRVTFALTAAEMAEKRSALAQYRTQLEIAGPVLLAFVRRTEPFTAFTHRQVRDAESFIMAGRHAVP